MNTKPKVMSRKTVRVDIPRGSPDGFVKLAKAIILNHKKLGKNSPLDDAVVKQLEAIIAEVGDKREEAAGMHAQGEKVNQQANTLLGIADGQTINSKDTAYHLIDDIRDVLLLAHKGNEEALEEYGFNVVVDHSLPEGEADKPHPMMKDDDCSCPA